MKIIPPTNCPSCNSLLVWHGHILFCESPSCGEQTSKKLEHFAKTMKIKGLGPATLKKLGINTLPELYDLSLGELSNRIGSEKMAVKLYKEITNSTNAPLQLLLPSLSIPLVGKTASEKLAKVCKSIYQINRETCRQAGLGEKTTNSLMSWLEYEFPLFEMLPFSFEFKAPKKEVEAVGVVCISGRLKTYKTKAEATKALESAGYKVLPRLTKEVTVLVNESGIDSSKTNRAKELGITIVTNIGELTNGNS